MKKTLVALAALAAVSTTFAQSTVVISGGVSMGLQKNTTRTAATGVAAAYTNTVTGVNTTGANSFNLTVSEDLGNGLKATGVIQNRINGTNSARETTGDMFVEVSGPFGSVRLGDFTFASLAGYNPFSSDTIATTGGTAGVGVGGDNSMQYVSPSFNGLTISAGLRRASAAAGKDGRGLKVTYAAGPLSVQVIRTNAVTETAVDAATATSIGATYDAGFAMLYMSNYRVTAGQNTAITVASTSATFVSATAAANLAEKGTQIGVAVPMGALTLRASLINRGTNALTQDRVAYGADYALSKRTRASAYFSKDKRAIAGDEKSSNYWMGLTHTY